MQGDATTMDEQTATLNGAKAKREGNEPGGVREAMHDDPLLRMARERLVATQAEFDQANTARANARTIIEAKEAERSTVCDEERAENVRHAEIIAGLAARKALIDQALSDARTDRDSADRRCTDASRIIRNSRVITEIETGERAVRNRSGRASRGAQ